jgi:hypothetical protein
MTVSRMVMPHTLGAGGFLGIVEALLFSVDHLILGARVLTIPEV